jgi:hypothetical protein
MADFKEIALEALNRMRSARGEDQLFSSDEIWQYAKDVVPSVNRPSAINWLKKQGHIVETGKIRNAVTSARAGSKTTEYRFGASKMTSTSVVKGLDSMCTTFKQDCEHVMKLDDHMILRLAASLLSKRFLILTGLAGSGKTKLAQAFARWISAALASDNPFQPGAILKGAQSNYEVLGSDAGVVRLRSGDGKTVPLPRMIIEEWADFIEANNIPETIGARELRDKIEAESNTVGYLHRLESHYKPAAFALVASRQKNTTAECVKMIAVGADWTSNDNVVGYPNALNHTEYITKPALDLMLHAINHSEYPHFLILDEMNLSHVERYFADILSALESEELIFLHSDAKRLAGGTQVPSAIEFPTNLFVIGTVNVDETTYMFSPKVLDRANVLEFRIDAEDLKSFLEAPVKPKLSEIASKGHTNFAKAFVAALRSNVLVPAEVKGIFDAELIVFFEVLQAHGAEFGYRVSYEASRFLSFYKMLGNRPDDETWFNDAFDCIVVQKFMPKLHGSRAKLGSLLKALWFLCVTDKAARVDNPVELARDASRSVEKKFEPSLAIPSEAPYPVSAKKIGSMWRLLMENGFVSFAEA